MRNNTFALSPLRSESVSYVAERGNKIKNFGFCFVFRSLISYFGSAENTFVQK